MKLKTRLLSLALALAMLVPVASASAQESYVKIRYAVPFLTITPIDQDVVLEKINEITRERIGAEIEPVFINASDYQQQMNLMISSGEVVDVYTTYWLTTDIVQGKIQGVTREQIEENAPGAFEAISEDVMNSTKLQGLYYGFPTVRDYAYQAGFLYRGDLADEYGIDMSRIKTPEDLDDLWAEVKEKIPDMYPLGANENNRVDVGFWQDFDNLGDDSQGSSAGLMNYGQDEPLTITNYYASEEYKEHLQTIRGWYEKGYIYPDSSFDKESGVSGLMAGRYFAYPAGLHPRTANDIAAASRMDVRACWMDAPALADTSHVIGTSIAVASTCENVDKALQFINLLFTEPEIVNLLNYGVEGVHYVKMDGKENMITFPEGVTAENTTYHVAQNWLFGNSLIGYIWERGSDDLWDQMVAFNESSLKSKALGFTFDVEPVKTEVAAISNVLNQYLKALGCGEVDPDEYLPKFLSALEAAGVDKLISEKQSQLDAYLQSR